MKISNTTSNYIQQAYNQPASQRQKPQQVPAESPSSAVADSINLSARTRDLQKISQSMDMPSENRDAYVADIKQKVETNQYNINVEAVAQKMAGALMDEIV